MEGGITPWKTQKIVNNSPTIESYSKPLPPPPDGYYWERSSDHHWQLLQYPSRLDSQANVNATAIVEHVILSGDTLPGICLKYGVSVVNIRRMNKFSGNAFHSRKVLQIPIQKGIPFQIQEQTPDVILQLFKNETSETTEEARFYLDETNWDLTEALQAWRKDDAWDKEKGVHKKESNSKFSKHIDVPTVVVSPAAVQAAVAELQLPDGSAHLVNLVIPARIIVTDGDLSTDTVTDICTSSTGEVSANISASDGIDSGDQHNTNESL